MLISLNVGPQKLYVFHPLNAVKAISPRARYLSELLLCHCMCTAPCSIITLETEVLEAHRI